MIRNDNVYFRLFLTDFIPNCSLAGNLPATVGVYDLSNGGKQLRVTALPCPSLSFLFSVGTLI
jgi:hypothetical protein